MSIVPHQMPLLLLFLVSGISAGTAVAETGTFFQGTETLQATLSAPLTTITRKRSEEELAGTFSLLDKEYTVKVKARGRSRRDKETCSFPPLRLNFRKSETNGTTLAGLDKVKLVTHCREPSERYEQSVLREFLAYKILNLFTDNSFRVRLLHLRYVDNEGQQKQRVKYAMLIEHRDTIAERLTLTQQEVPQTTASALDPAYTNLTSVFQYLIGNTDFSQIAGSPDHNCCHNHILLGAEGEPLLSVPYDFDRSGLVDAPHAVPGTRFKLRNVRQRLYRGRCINNDRLEATLSRFQDKREEIFALIDGIEEMSDSTKAVTSKYVQKFYDTIDKPKLVQRRLVRACI